VPSGIRDYFHTVGSHTIQEVAMKNPRPIAGILFALAFALLTSACTSAQAGTTRIRELHTYAIVAVDDQGVLSQAELAKIQIGIVQYLTDEGYVRSGQVFTDDVVHADMVFRVHVAWMDAGKSFAVTEVAPTYGGGAPVTEYAEEDSMPYLPSYYDSWYYDNSYDDYGYFYGPYAPWIFAPFAPIYVWDRHRHPSPPIVHHPPSSKGLPEKHRPPWRNGYTRYSPRPPQDDDALRHFPVRRAYDPARDDRQAQPPPSTWRARNPDADHRPPSSDASTPRKPDTDHRPQRDSATASAQRPPPNDRPAPSRDAAPAHVRSPDSGSRSSSDSTSRGSRNSGSADRSPPPAREYSQPSPSYSPPPPSSPPPSAPPPSSPPPASSSESNSRPVDKER
jgi:hypothetical protein